MPGGEHSAHYYFRDFWGADNGMLAALHVMAELRGSHGPLSALTKEFALYAESGEINTVVTDQLAAMRAVEELFSGRGEVDHLDGVTITSGSDTCSTRLLDSPPSPSCACTRTSLSLLSSRSSSSVSSSTTSPLRSATSDLFDVCI